MDDLKVGDIVEMKSGSIPMTIIAINGDKAICQWSNNGQPQQGEFNLVGLTKFTPILPFSI